MGDDAAASLSPVRDARRKSLFSFLRSRSTCQGTSEKSGLGLALGLVQSCLFPEKASACVGLHGRGQQLWEARLLVVGNTCRDNPECGEELLGRRGRASLSGLWIKGQQTFLWNRGFVGHLISVATIQLHYCGLQGAVHNT